MAQRTVNLPDIGEVLLAKRRGTKNLRLSVQPDGRIRVGLPAWAPYAAGIRFALTRREWIKKHRSQIYTAALVHEAKIGKSFRLIFVSDYKATKTRSRVLGTSITITSNQAYTSEAVQAVAVRASERALKTEAEKLLGIRLNQLAKRHGFSYKTLRIKRLRSRWGSCSSDKVITLNYFLMQLPWELIDYVIIHELVHTRHLNHSAGFWETIEMALPEAKNLRKEIKKYRPSLMPG